MARFVHVETTLSGSTASVERFATAVVRRRLAACANVVPGVRSIYWWKGKLERDRESLVVFKTTPARTRALVKAIRETHPYEVPYIAWTELELGSLAYARWLRAESRARDAPARPARPDA